jgi:hypothetical protein
MVHHGGAGTTAACCRYPDSVVLLHVVISQLWIPFVYCSGMGCRKSWFRSLLINMSGQLTL